MEVYFCITIILWWIECGNAEMEGNFKTAILEKNGWCCNLEATEMPGEEADSPRAGDVQSPPTLSKTLVTQGGECHHADYQAS